MNIEDFEIQEETIATVAQGRIQLKGLLDCGEFSQEEYDRQMEEMSEFSMETMKLKQEKLLILLDIVKYRLLKVM